MAAFEDFNYFQSVTTRGAHGGRIEATPALRRDALRAELERLHVELRRMRRSLARRDRWGDRLRRLVRRVVLGSAPARRMRSSA